MRWEWGVIEFRKQNKSLNQYSDLKLATTWDGNVRLATLRSTISPYLMHYQRKFSKTNLKKCNYKSCHKHQQTAFRMRTRLKAGRAAPRCRRKRWSGTQRRINGISVRMWTGNTKQYWWKQLTKPAKTAPCLERNDMVVAWDGGRRPECNITNKITPHNTNK